MINYRSWQAIPVLYDSDKKGIFIEITLFWRSVELIGVVGPG